MKILVADIFLISSFCLILTSIALIIVLLKFGKSHLHLIWGLFNGAILVWGSGLFLAGITDNYQQALIYLRIGFAGAIFISIFFFHVSTFFHPFKKYLLKIAYFQGFIFLIWDTFAGDKFLPSAYKLFNSFYYLKLTSLPSLVCSAIWSVWIVLGFFGLYKAYTISSGFKKLQLRYLSVGMIIGWGGGLLYVLPFFGIKVFPFGNFTIPLYCIISTYAILRYHIMGINVVIKKTTVYSLSAGLLGSFFVVFVLATTKYLTDYLGISSFTIMAIAAVIIALLFNPVRNRIQTIIDRIFYKKTYDYYSVIQKVSHELVSTFSPKGIYSFVGDTITSALGLKNFYMLSLFPDDKYRIVHSISSEKRDKAKKEMTVNIDSDSKNKMADIEFSVQTEEKVINANSEVVNLLREFKDVVIREELPLMPKISQEVVNNVNTDLMPFKGEAVVPVFIDGKLELLMVLSEKLSGDIFTNEDVKLLNTISDQTAIAKMPDSI